MVGSLKIIWSFSAYRMQQSSIKISEKSVLLPQKVARKYDYTWDIHHMIFQGKWWTTNVPACWAVRRPNIPHIVIPPRKEIREPISWFWVTLEIYLRTVWKIYQLTRVTEISLLLWRKKYSICIFFCFVYCISGNISDLCGHPELYLQIIITNINSKKWHRRRTVKWW